MMHVEFLNPEKEDWETFFPISSIVMIYIIIFGYIIFSSYEMFNLNWENEPIVAILFLILFIIGINLLYFFSELLRFYKNAICRKLDSRTNIDEVINEIIIKRRFNLHEYQNRPGNKMNKIFQFDKCEKVFKIDNSYFFIVRTFNSKSFLYDKRKKIYITPYVASTKKEIDIFIKFIDTIISNKKIAYSDTIVIGK